MSKPKITVVVITYNQEDLIGRAMDSIIEQKEHLYEIIVADDCSQDSTWEKVLAYQEQYPGVVKAYRNTQNLGIVGNIQFTWTKINGNLIYYCAGDDVLCEGIFQRSIQRLETEHIDYDNDAYAIYCDFADVKPDGSQVIYRQDIVMKHKALDLKLRNLIFNRSMGYSGEVLRHMRPVEGNLGLNEDGLLDVQVQMLSQFSFYFSFVGSRYFSGIGVSVSADLKELRRSEINTLQESLDFFQLDTKNVQWIKYEIAYLTLLSDVSVKNFLAFTILFLENFSLVYGSKFMFREMWKFLRGTKILFKTKLLY